MTYLHVLIVGIGGAAGAVFRVYLSELIGRKFPWGTILVNVLGALLVGIIIMFFSAYDSSSAKDAELFSLGFCGGFTTFSSFSYQTLNMLKHGHKKYAAVNILFSIIFSIIAVWIGLSIGKYLFIA